MRGRNYLHSFATLFIILVLLIIVGCQQSINLPPEPGIYLMEEGNPIMITKIEPDSSGERYPDESIPTIGIPSPVFYITDPEIDTNYLVLLFLNGEESVRYSIDQERGGTIRIEVVEDLAAGIYCFDVDDPFSTEFSPTWCFISDLSISNEEDEKDSNQRADSSTEPPPETLSETSTPTLEEPTPTTKPEYLFDLAFASDISGRFRIYKFNTVTGESELQKIPAGSKAAYWSTFCGDDIMAEVTLDGNADVAIAVLNPDKAKTSYFSVPLSIKQTGVPRCNPEGNLLAYSAQEANQWGLYISNLDTGDTDRFYPPNNVTSGYASWVLDRNDFAFNVIDTSSSNLIYILEDALSNPNYIKFGSGGNPSLSPDGSQLVYSCKAPTVNERVLCIDSLHGSGEREELVVIYRRPAEGLEKNQIQPASMWSIDGEWIYYASAEDGDWDIYRIHPNGTGRENLTDDWGDSNEIYPSVRW